MTRLFHHADAMHSAYPRMTAFQINPMMGARRVFVMTIQGSALNGGISPQEYFEPEEVELAGLGRIDRERELAMPAYGDTPFLEKSREPQNQNAADTFQVRPLRGLVVRDANGQFYESIGQNLRPLQRIARSPKGELLELLPVGGEPRAFEEQRQLATNEEEQETEIRSKAAPQMRPADPQRSSESERAPRPAFRGFRRLFVEPGVTRVVTFGEFRSMLAPQCANADRLRDSHRVRALVRIYEATYKQPIAAFFNSIQNEDPSPVPLQPLGEANTAKLDLGKLLPAQGRIPRPMHREQGMVLPYERFFRLVLSVDPSNETASATETIESEAPTKSAIAPVPQQTLRTAIPETYSKPWEFRFTRDEALYDMNRAVLTQGLLRKIGRWLKQKFSSEKGLQKWQALLNGKSLDDQLWAVRPPQNAFEMRAIKDWARSTLALAGYESQSMLLEWEVFWRRKGV
ncbi:MAG TPA: hypothetical protein VNX66_16275 [Candidatus Sulfotelmatobacter sp.]|jgi:hypothetical protein|nr:hypothetical protein [Candidatus Sulfotelmatobacter sp.]